MFRLLLCPPTESFVSSIYAEGEMEKESLAVLSPTPSLITHQLVWSVKRQTDLPLIPVSTLSLPGPWSSGCPFQFSFPSARRRRWLGMRGCPQLWVQVLSPTPLEEAASSLEPMEFTPEESRSGSEPTPAPLSASVAAPPCLASLSYGRAERRSRTGDSGWEGQEGRDSGATWRRMERLYLPLRSPRLPVRFHPFPLWTSFSSFQILGPQWGTCSHKSGQAGWDGGKSW